MNFQDLPLYHSAPLTPGRRPLWCLEPACNVATEPFAAGFYKCPVCGKNYPERDEPVSPENWPEAFPGHRAAERKAAAKAAEAAAPKQQKFKLAF